MVALVSIKTAAMNGENIPVQQFTHDVGACVRSWCTHVYTSSLVPILENQAFRQMVGRIVYLFSLLSLMSNQSRTSGCPSRGSASGRPRMIYQESGVEYFKKEPPQQVRARSLEGNAFKSMRPDMYPGIGSVTAQRKQPPRVKGMRISCKLAHFRHASGNGAYKTPGVWTQAPFWESDAGNGPYSQCRAGL